MTQKHNLSHLTSSGHARMVDVGAKLVSERAARAQAVVRLGPKIALTLKKTGALAKGNVIETARIAGILAAKRTASLIPMCHILPLDFVSVDTSWRGNSLRIETSARCAGRTGVEMEALVAASVAALTVYDMCKSVDKGIVIQDIRLLEKSGGKSGHWRRRGKKGQGSREEHEMTHSGLDRFGAYRKSLELFDKETGIEYGNDLHPLDT